MEIKVNAKALAAAYLFQAKNDVRYYLNGILIQTNKNDGGVNVVGTDGFRMIVIHDPNGECEEDIILNFESPTITKFKRITKDVIPPVATITTGENTLCEYQGDISSVKVVDGTYPNWQQIMPDDINKIDSVEMQTFNGDLLKSFCMVPKILGDKHHAMGLKSDGNGKLFVHYAPMEYDITVRGILMGLIKSPLIW